MSDNINTLLGQVQTLAEHGDWDISDAPVWLEVMRLARLGAALEAIPTHNETWMLKVTVKGHNKTWFGDSAKEAVERAAFHYRSDNT